MFVKAFLCSVNLFTSNTLIYAIQFFIFFISSSLEKPVSKSLLHSFFSSLEKIIVLDLDSGER